MQAAYDWALMPGFANTVELMQLPKGPFGYACN
jgi:hypothetical protein